MLELTLQYSIYLSILQLQLNVQSISSTFTINRNAWAILIYSIRRTSWTEQNYCAYKDREICSTSIDLNQYQRVDGATIQTTGMLLLSDLTGLSWLLDSVFMASLLANPTSSVNTNTSFKIHLAMSSRQKLRLKKSTKLRKYTQ